MARYKPYDVDQDKFIPVSFRHQILPGSFEHTLNEIVEQHIDLTPFEARTGTTTPAGWPTIRRCCSGSCCTATTRASSPAANLVRPANATSSSWRCRPTPTRTSWPR